MDKKIYEVTGLIRDAHEDVDGPGGEQTVEGLDDILSDIINEVNETRQVKSWWETDVTVKVTVELVKAEKAKDEDGDD